MRFAIIRELRHRSRDLWKQVASGAEVILTSQGKPIALLTSVTGDTLEAALKAVRDTNVLVSAFHSRLGNPPAATKGTTASSPSGGGS